LAGERPHGPPTLMEPSVGDLQHVPWENDPIRVAESIPDCHLEFSEYVENRSCMKHPCEPQEIENSVYLSLIQAWRPLPITTGRLLLHALHPKLRDQELL
jgi:hypothetical protein